MSTVNQRYRARLGSDWRFEPYLALQYNKPDDDLQRVLGISMTFKVYVD